MLYMLIISIGIKLYVCVDDWNIVPDKVTSISNES